MFGNAPVGNILGPGTIINNVTLFKIFQVTEKLDLRFRAEAFNMVNHPNFSSPDVTLGDANFGAYKISARPPTGRVCLRIAVVSDGEDL